MVGLRKFGAPEFIFGMGTMDLAGQYARNSGAPRIFLVSDPGVRRTGWTKRVSEDCAKGIGIIASNGGRISDWEGIDLVSAATTPLIRIPTTAGSSADVSQFSIIADTTRRVKMELVSKALVPDVALIDPFPLTTLSPTLTAFTGMDSLTHAVEAYVSHVHSPFTDVRAATHSLGGTRPSRQTHRLGGALISEDLLHETPEGKTGSNSSASVATSRHTSGSTTRPWGRAI
jgi:alcohol dehydrogenase class IV